MKALILESIEQSPFTGTGKPEALKYNHAGKWSHRISGEHRLIYKAEEGMIKILSMRGHYQ
jgi:toxin YoeB